jgi:phospho-N-acetylmuramoyl-pentapeptide-transferase
MLVELADFEHLIGPLRLFRYLTFRSVLAAATALAVGFLAAPFIIGRLRAFKASQTLRDASEVGRLAELHAGKKDTPTMGGLLIFVSIVFSTVLWARLNIYVLVSLFVYAGLTVIGFLDDYLKITRKSSGGLSSRYKLAGQAVITLGALGLLLGSETSVVAVGEIWVPFIKGPVMTTAPLWFLFGFFFLVLAGASNAINLTDGIDGLAIGCTVTVALVYGIMAYACGHALIAKYLFISNVPGTGELAVVCASLVGASLAFLWYNSHPAEVFMGDTGSLALGGLIGVVAFIIHQPLTLIIVGGIFVLEAVSVIVQVASFKTRRKRVFLMAPIHHHFELKGWAESKVVIRFWILSLIFAISGLATLKLR